MISHTVAVLFDSSRIMKDNAENSEAQAQRTRQDAPKHASYSRNSAVGESEDTKNSEVGSKSNTKRSMSVPKERGSSSLHLVSLININSYLLYHNAVDSLTKRGQSPAYEAEDLPIMRKAMTEINTNTGGKFIEYAFHFYSFSQTSIGN